MLVLTATEARAVDREAIETFGIPSLVLMEHAARAVAEAVLEVLATEGGATERRGSVGMASAGTPGGMASRGTASVGGTTGGRTVVITGAGNNGGDGYAVARLLHCAGRQVRVVAVASPDSLSGDAATQASIWSRLGGSTSPFSPSSLEGERRGDVIVDALLGTGLSRPPEGAYAEAIEAMNRARSQGATVVSVDLPSGLSADTGRAPGSVVRADRTVTFGTLKRGLVLHPGADWAGELEVADISIPPDVLRAISPTVRLLEEEPLRRLLPMHQADSHKGSYGHVLVVAGSDGKTGAAALSARAALVGGAGLVTVASRPVGIAPILSHAMELMGQPLPGSGPLGDGDEEALVEASQKKAAILVGPGIPRGSGTASLLGKWMAKVRLPFVLDADALNALAGHTDCLKRAQGDVVITPHPGEMARLVGCSIEEVQADRIDLARAFAEAHGCTVILKGARTVVASAGGDVAICPTGNPGMATAGSGDVLGGLVAALLARGMSPWDGARVAVYAHGLAGDRMVARRGLSGLVAGDLLEGITEVWVRWKS